MKLSKCPAETLIITDGGEWYLKESEGLWVALNTHCIDCADESNIANSNIDEVIISYTIKALPYAVAVKLAEDVRGYEMVEWHIDKTVEQYIEDAIRRSIHP